MLEFGAIFGPGAAQPFRGHAVYRPEAVTAERGHLAQTGVAERHGGVGPRPGVRNGAAVAQVEEGDRVHDFRFQSQKRHSREMNSTSRCHNTVKN